MRFYLGCDHAGFDIKNDVIAFLNNLGCEVVDLGAKSKDSVDYPDFAHAVSVSVLEDKGSFGVLICGTGIGISISANKHAGIRAALCHDAYTATMSRVHNDANVVVFGQRVVGLGTIESILEAFVKSKFEGGRHENRVKKIECY